MQTEQRHQPRSSFDVVVVGSLNLDLVATTRRLPGPGETVLGTAFAEHAGGKGLNQAVAAARAGASVAFIGAVGDDEAGHRLRAVAVNDGIDVSGLAVSATSATGRALITVDDHAENSIVVIPGANALVGVGSELDALPPASVVLAQLEIPIESVAIAVQRAHGAGARTVLNPAPAQVLPDELLAACDIVVPNEHELELIGGIASLHERGVSAVVVTRRGRRHGQRIGERRDDRVVARCGAGHARRHHRRRRCVLWRPRRSPLGRRRPPLGRGIRGGGRRVDDDTAGRRAIAADLRPDRHAHRRGLIR